MKKIISVLVAMLMLLTMVPAFAAVAVDPAYPSKAYLNDLSSIADGATSMTGSPFSGNASYPISFAFSGGQFSFSHSDAAKSGLVYIGYGGSYEYDNYVFGYDVKFSGLTSNSGDAVFSNNPGTQNTVFADSAQAKIDSGEYVVGTLDPSGAYLPEEVDTKNDAGNWKRKASKTAWCFKKSGDDLSFTTRKADGALINGANGKPAIFFGSAQLEQGKTYTYKVNVNTVEHTYSTVIIDEEGNISTGVSGECQNAFVELYKLDTSIAAGTDAAVTIDNIFVENYFGITIAPSYQANAEGTVTFGATLPVNLTDAKVYINDTFVEDIALTPGEIDYTITSALPAGTGYGEAVIEIRGKINGEDVKATAVTDITSTFLTGNGKTIDTPDTNASKLGLRGFASGGTLSVPEDDQGVWAVTEKGQIDITDAITPALKGIVDYSFDFKTATNLNQIRVRMTANTDNGAAFTWEKGNGDPYHYFLNGYASRKIGKMGVEYKLNDWNTFKVRADFYENKYYAYINGTLCEEGTLYAEKGVTDQVVDVRMILNYSDANAATSTVLLDNFKLVEYCTVTAPATVTFGYENGTSVDYADEALTSVGLSKVEVKTGLPFDSASITDATAKVVNADGDKVNTTLSYADGTFTATFGGAILADGDYKLVIDKAATLKGNAIGLDREIDFAVKSEDSIIASEADKTVSSATTLKVYAPNADKVVFAVNDSTVVELNDSDAVNGVYSYEYTPVNSGIQIFDAYIYEGDDIKLLTSNFNYLPGAQSMKQANNMNDKKEMDVASGATGEFVDGAGFDGSVAYKLTSKVGTIIDGAENKDSLNSNTSSFGPSNNLYRKMVNEFELKAGENTYVYTEIGYSMNGKTYADRETVAVGNSNVSSYQTFYIRGSKAPNEGIFCKNGTILGTSTQYTPNKWYRFKQTIDFDTMTNIWEVYEEGTDGKLSKLVLKTNDDISGIASTNAATAFPNWKNDIVITFKYNLCVLPNDNAAAQAGVPATVVVDNFNRYSPTTLPTTKTVNGSDSYVIEEGTADAAVVLTSAYDNDAANAFDASLITVKVNGEAYDAATINVTDGANFTVSGLAGVKAGSKIEIVISEYAFFNGATTDTELVIPLYVADKNALCVFPFATASDSAGNLTAMAKYINGGSSVDIYLILTQYNGSKVANTKFVTNLIEGGESGVIYGTLPNYSATADTTIRLWNKADISALAPVTMVPGNNVE